MDRAQLTGRVLGNLDDLGISYYTQDDANQSVKDAYDRVSVLTGCITKATAIINTGEPYWDLRNYISDYLYPIGIYNYATNSWLNPVDRLFLDSIRWDWELWNGQPNYFTPIDYRRIAVAPHLSTTTGVLFLIYRATPEPLSDSSIFLLPQSIETILEFYATADLLEQGKEYKKANFNWESYQKLLVECKSAIREMAAVDKMRVMQPFMPLPLFGPGASSGGSDAMFIDNETPSGTIDGSNATFTLSLVPSPAASLCLVRDGSVLAPGIGYTLNGSTITMNSGYIPVAPSITDPLGTILRASYRV